MESPVLPLLNDRAPALVLASASQRRQKFLYELGLTFAVVAADLDETPLDGETPAAMTERLADGEGPGCGRPAAP